MHDSVHSSGTHEESENEESVHGGSGDGVVSSAKECVSSVKEYVPGGKEGVSRAGSDEQLDVRMAGSEGGKRKQSGIQVEGAKQTQGVPSPMRSKLPPLPEFCGDIPLDGIGYGSWKDMPSSKGGLGATSCSSLSYTWVAELSRSMRYCPPPLRVHLRRP